MRKLLIIILLCVQPLLGYCQNYLMQLRGGSFMPSATIGMDFTDKEIVNGRFYRYIQFFEMPSEAQKHKLEEMGIKLLNYIPDNIYSVSIASDVQLQRLRDPNIRSLFILNPNYKLSKLLTGKKLPEYALREAGKIELVISIYPDLSMDDGSALLKAAGLKVLHKLNEANAYRVLADVHELNPIAALPYVSFIEPVDEAPVADNLVGVTNHRSNTIATNYAGGLKYDGRGVVVAMNDDGIIGPHIDYQGRIVRQNINYNSGDHGDHCAGTIFGGGNIDPTTRGMAFGAKLDVYGVNYYYYATYFQAFDNIRSAYDIDSVRITSTSYKVGVNAGYTALARVMDVQINEMPQLMHVFAAGNQWNSLYSITGGHSQAKNLITVSNVTAQDALAPSSSCGPATDGRIKPDICAVGSDVRSTIDVNTYSVKSGTSMSCPGVAGVLAQLYQAYKSMHGGENPPSALIKAAVLNTADDIGNPGPDFRFGYGRINARRAFSILKNNQYQTGVITQGASQTHTIAVPANVAEVKIMVYWHDKEGTAGAAKALVNNLDMTVATPAATTVLPWVLNAASANTNAIRGIDALNNMEQVTIQTPVAGNYTVNISGFSVPQGPQHYYLVYEFVMNDIVVTYPMGGESIVPGIPEMIRWDTYEKTGTFTVQYSTDNGASWININTAVPGSVRSLSWTPPATVTGQALVKVTRGAESGQSDANFSILGVPTGLTVDWVCIDSMQVSYQAVPNATGYVISVLGNEYMDSVGYSTTTTCVVRNINTQVAGWFSVHAVGANNCKGRRAFAVPRVATPYRCTTPDDLGIVSISSPSTNTTLNCNVAQASESLIITLKNYGANPLSSIRIGYSLNNGTPVPATYSGIVSPGATVNYTFPIQISFSAGGDYVIKVWAKHANDFRPGNDSVVIHKSVLIPPTRNVPYIEDFEAFTLCDTTANCGLGMCNLRNGWINAKNNQDDNIDWRINAGPTASRSSGSTTGPAMDYNPGMTVNGKYIYLEADGCFQQTASLISPCINLVGQTKPELRFSYHMLGQGMGSLHVDVFANNAWTNDIAGVLSGDQGDRWKNYVVPLTAFAGKMINLRFRGVTGATYESDMAIDDVRVLDGKKGDTLTPAGKRVMPYREDLIVDVFPNPSTALFSVQLANVSTAVNLVVTDINGRVVDQRLILPETGVINTLIDLKTVPSGVYLLTLKNEHQVINKKLVKL